MSPPRTVACRYAATHRVHWIARGSGKRTCATCHPPADPGAVATVVVCVTPADFTAADWAAARALRERRNGSGSVPA